MRPPFGHILLCNKIPGFRHNTRLRRTPHRQRSPELSSPRNILHFSSNPRPKRLSCSKPLRNRPTGNIPRRTQRVRSLNPRHMPSRRAPQGPNHNFANPGSFVPSDHDHPSPHLADKPLTGNSPRSLDRRQSNKHRSHIYRPHRPAAGPYGSARAPARRRPKWCRRSGDTLPLRHRTVSIIASIASLRVTGSADMSGGRPRGIVSHSANREKTDLLSRWLRDARDDLHGQRN